MEKNNTVSLVKNKFSLEQRLKDIEEEYEKLVVIVSSGKGKSDEFQKSLIRIGEIEELVKFKKQWTGIFLKISELEKIVDNEEQDEGIKELVEEELEVLRKRKEDVEKNILKEFSPRNPEDDKNAIMEIRPGTGGEEASLFAGDLFRMYTKYCEKKKYTTEILNSHFSERGGIKEIIFFVKEKGAYGEFKYESGVHRVQRIPETESSGRIHTSAATVAVFPEVEETEIRIDPEELRIDTFSSSGAGGQHVNRTASAVRITHIPTGLVVSCQDERSQLQNKSKALKILRARLQQIYENEKKDKIDTDRKQQVGAGKRSEKIRTYNFPQNRITDHRINLSLHNLDRIMEGELQELLNDIKKGLEQK